MRPGWAGLGARALGSDSLTLPIPSCSLLRKFLNLAVPQFPYLSQQRLGEDLSLGAAAEIKLVNMYQYMLKEYPAKDKCFLSIIVIINYYYYHLPQSIWGESNETNA